MSIFKRKVINGAFKMMLPDRYYDDIYVNRMLNRKNLAILSPLKLIWCFIHGFFPQEYLLYDLDTNDYRNYIPSRINYKKRWLNGSYNAILGNKILFEKHIRISISGIENMHVVENLAFIENGILHPLQDKIAAREFSSLFRRLEKNDLVFKPALGDGGTGIFMVSKQNGKYLVNDKIVRSNELLGFMRSLNNYVIQDRIIQRGFSRDIYSGSVNTIRIATMVDPLSGKPFIGYAAHRFGSPESGFVDNVNQGGLFSVIDLATGKLGKLVDSSDHKRKKLYDHHPVTLKTIYDQRIPGWESITGRIIEMARRMPYLKYVGWDIILSGNELYVLEGNVSPGIAFQMIKPMKEFPAWSFFKHYKYVN
jgi:hypothetical protein